MWFDAEIADEGEDENNSDSGMSENINDSHSISDVEDIEPLDMEMIHNVYNNQQLELHQLHLLHPILEADDETASVDSGANFSDNKEEELEILDEDLVEDEEFWNVDHIISDSSIRVAGIADDWIVFDEKVKGCNITYKLQSFSPSFVNNMFTNKLDYILHVIIPALHQHDDSDIFTKLKPNRIPSDFKGPLERSLSLEVIEQRILHCYYSDYSQCLADFESLFFYESFPKQFYDYGHHDSIGKFFHRLLHRLPHEEKELLPPLFKSASTSSPDSSSSNECIQRKRKLSFTTSPDEATSKKRALIISTNDLLNRFKTFSPS